MRTSRACSSTQKGSAISQAATAAAAAVDDGDCEFNVVGLMVYSYSDAPRRLRARSRVFGHVRSEAGLQWWLPELGLVHLLLF